MKKKYLLCPGPVTVSERVRNATLHPDICHRMPEFEKIIISLRSDLLQVFRAKEEYTILLFTGSGTAANESVIGSLFQRGEEALLINNGEFGCRLEEILTTYDVNIKTLKYEWGKKPDLTHVEDCLEENKNIKAVVMVFHETSTSVINPVKEIGEIVKRYGKKYIIDGVSAVGGEDVDMDRDNIDFCTTSSNKCIASLPGVSIICARVSEIKKMENNRPRTIYMNLYNHYLILERLNQTQNTPSTTMFYALHAAVEQLLEEGLENRIHRYKRCAAIIREGVKKMGLEMLVEEQDASNTVTCVFLPMKIMVDEFIQRMDQKGYTVYPGKRHLKERNMFQIGNMGHIFEDQCHVFLDVMNETLRGMM